MSNTRLVESEKLGEKDVFVEAAGPKKVNMTMPGNQNAGSNARWCFDDNASWK